MSVHHPNKNIHKIGPSPKKRVSKLNVIIEESDYKRVNENSESNETSILNDQSKSSQASQQNINNSMYLPRQVPRIQQIRRKQLSPFRNGNHNSQVIIINNHKFMKSKSPKRQTRVIVNSSPPQTQSISQVVSEKEANLLRKIRILQNRITQLHQEKQQFILRANKQNQECYEENERIKRKIHSLEKQKQKVPYKSINTPIQQISSMEHQENERKIQNYKVIISNLEKALKQSRVKNEQLSKENINLKERELQKDKSSLCGSKSRKSEDNQTQNLVDLSQIKLNSLHLEERVKELSEQLNSKIEENQSIKYINEELQNDVKEKQKKLQEIQQELCQKMSQSKKIIELMEIQKSDSLQTKMQTQVQKVRAQFEEILKNSQVQIQNLKRQNEQLRQEMKKNESKEDGCEKCKQLMETFMKLNGELEE